MYASHQSNSTSRQHPRPKLAIISPLAPGCLRRSTSRRLATVDRFVSLPENFREHPVDADLPGRQGDAEGRLQLAGIARRELCGRGAGNG
jgi:hypothetical protein